MNQSGLTISLLTPPGRGAVASILVAGPGAIELVSPYFSPASGKPLPGVPLGRVVFGSFRSLAEAAEEVVVGVHRADHVEIHCHGGPWAAAAVIKTLCGKETEPTSWQQAAEQFEQDSTTAEARIALAAARTERTALILLDQYQGALRKRVDEAASLLQGEPTDCATTLVSLSNLLALAPLGQRLTAQWRVFIAGPPNVGKSSLMNALVGYQRSIVFHQPGTTRDLLSALTAFDGWPVELVDSAGLRESDDPLETAGVTRAEAGLASADLILWVQDATEKSEPVARPRLRVDVNAIVVNNKVDLVPNQEETNTTSAVAVSALTGFGIDQLCERIVQHLVPNPPARGDAVVFTPRQERAVSEAVAALREGKTSEALDRLRNL
jgi:tRNA modification GTPase